MKEQKPIRNFEDLPEEWQNVDFLRKQFHQSIVLTSVFGGTAAIGWVYNKKIHTEIKTDPAANHGAAPTAMGLTALGATGFAILGALATLKLRKLLRQGETIKNNRDNPPAP